MPVFELCGKFIAQLDLFVRERYHTTQKNCEKVIKFEQINMCIHIRLLKKTFYGEFTL